MTVVERKSALGVGTAITMVAAVIGILVWLGLSPTQQITRAEVEAKVEKLETKEHADEVHGRHDDGLDKINEKLDVLIQSNAAARAIMERLERGRR